MAGDLEKRVPRIEIGGGICQSATAGITAVQNAVPSEMRGLSVAVQGFLYVLIGLGIGPTSVAIVTEYIFRSSSAVGPAIFTVTVPTTLGMIVLMVLSLRHYRNTRDRMRLAPAGPRPDHVSL